MKRVIGLVFLYGAASCIAWAAAPSAPKHDAKPTSSPRPAARTKVDITQLAPADEYFGPLKQSIIGINNTIRDLGRRYDVNHDIPSQTLASAELTERSIRDWEHRYPRDTQLPRSVYLLQRLYTKVLYQPSRDRAQITANWLFSDFNGSPQARELKKTLALEHLAPLPPPTPAATPTLYPSVFGSNYSSTFGRAAPQAAAPAAPSTPAPAASRSALRPSPAPSSAPAASASATPHPAPASANSVHPSSPTPSTQLPTRH